MPTQPDFGIDIVCTDDLDPLFRLTSQVETVQQALVRRLQSPIGSLFLDPRYGLDVRGLISSATDRGPNAASFVAGAVRTQILMDERVESVVINQASYDAQARAVQIRMTVYAAAGPFGLVLTLDSNNLTIITG